MANHPLSSELIFAGLTVFYLVVGLGMVWFAKAVLKIESRVFYASLLLIPVLIHVSISGRLVSLKAPGGLEAKFASVSKQSVEFAGKTIKFSEQDMAVVSKLGAPSLEYVVNREQILSKLMLAVAQ